MLLSEATCGPDALMYPGHCVLRRVKTDWMSWALNSGETFDGCSDELGGTAGERRMWCFLDMRVESELITTTTTARPPVKMHRPAQRHAYCQDKQINLVSTCPSGSRLSFEIVHLCARMHEHVYLSMWLLKPCLESISLYKCQGLGGAISFF